jgi:UDP-N-acetyl-D-glucosamine dehydrogenase
MDLLKKIQQKKACVGVIGLGYVGLPLAVELAKAGYSVTGIDLDAEKVAQIQQGHSYIMDVPPDDIAMLVRQGRLTAVTDYEAITRLDTVSICVPTPLTKTKDPDVSYIVTAVDGLEKYMHPGMLIILESTTYPGTTEELVKARLDKLGYQVGVDYFICFSPERVDPGNAKYNTKNTPKVIGGATPQCLALGTELYSSFLPSIVQVSSPRVAEMVKLLENTFRSVNIGLVNELALMCDRMGVDVWEVIDAASTKPFGYMPFYPGPGIGGHCIPLDPMYLAWKAKTFDFYNRFIELASDVNGNMPRHVLHKISEVLNTRKKCLNGSKVLLLGMAYKKDIDDLRESPGLEIYRLLKEQGAVVEYSDPLVAFFREGTAVVRSVPLTEQNLADYDIAVLCTNHSAFDYQWIARYAQLILDTRNAFRGIKGSHIYKIGSGECGRAGEELAKQAAVQEAAAGKE